MSRLSLITNPVTSSPASARFAFAFSKSIEVSIISMRSASPLLNQGSGGEASGGIVARGHAERDESARRSPGGDATPRRHQSSPRAAL